ncbi:enoyl-CoA hydratase/isomerase family protein [Pelobacter propionicus]|uniref:Enoyl-CoA hydratase/isomerase n=1 Tax=Pelobacter propionicus (strain DSM 2379 / NBRC 103807 / OttBd1) TaxID=338966 RepID=A1AK64_PELPD|nr:enoyl-CoA hydratase/isomerase family protein [Pelobacter propionicus]ABK97734.1 Enoyl-CoA hydratase/isomerase [Pelobacter propionicus DSM 2379]
MAFDTSFDEGIIRFTFDNNGYNAISPEVLDGLHEVIGCANANDGVKGIILSGQGRIFSSGYELGTFISFRDRDECLTWSKTREALMYDLFTCKKPVVAAINGHAMAAGLIVAMTADYRIAIDNPRIRIGMPEINIGIPLSNSEAEIMKFGLGSDKNYRELLFSGSQISPEVALQKGIVDELVADGQVLLDKAKAKVRSLIDTPGRAFIMLKQVEKRQVAEYIRKSAATFDWNAYADCFFHEAVVAEMKKIKASMK